MHGGKTRFFRLKFDYRQTSDSSSNVATCTGTISTSSTTAGNRKIEGCASRSGYKESHLKEV
ncbi:MAG: hypothetical protein WBL67_04270, partial [Nitrososphaeraceae archaeon]